MKQPVEKKIDEVLGRYRDIIGDAYSSYHNHVVRMATFCLALRDCSTEEQRKIEVAACFHDIGIWTAHTLDYLPPSVPPARAYLAEQGLQDWGDEITAMILEHHRLRRVPDPVSPLVEVFRRGDLVDFSLGLVRFGLDPKLVREVKAAYPNAGFHRFLVRQAGAWFIRHPLNPAPMMKW